MNRSILRDISRKIASIFAPRDIRCVVCGKDIFDDTGFCEDCVKEVSFNNGKTCKRCGVAIDGAEDYCGNCAFDKVHFDKAYSAFRYDKAIQYVIKQIKFHNKGYVCRTFAKYLVYVAQKNDIQYDVVTYVPMSKRSQRQRRYNQSKLLADNFCDILGIQGSVTALAKVKETDRQEHLNKQQRIDNVAGAFGADKEIVKGKRVLVIDDVKTSGATLNECARVLKKAGASEVICLTVASRVENFRMEVEEDI